MATSLNINDVLCQVKQLNKQEQQTLLQRITYLLKRSETKNTSARLISISGVGSEIQWPNRQPA